MMYERILTAMSAKEFLLQVTVGMGLVSAFVFFLEGGNKTLASFWGHGGRQLVSGTIVLSLMVTCTGLLLPSFLCLSKIAAVEQGLGLWSVRDA